MKKILSFVLFMMVGIMGVSAQDTYGIVGELTGGWPSNEDLTDVMMTQSTENPNVYTLEVTQWYNAQKYEYKLRANRTWDNSYQLPAEGNQSYTFETAGFYTLTFTADIENHQLTLEAVPTLQLDPAPGVVESLKDITIKLAGSAHEVSFGKNKKVYLRNQACEVSFDEEANEIKIVGPQEFTDPGTYKLSFDGSAIIIDESACGTMEYTYTIEKAAVNMDNFVAQAYTEPAAGVVTELRDINVLFPENITVDETKIATLTNKTTKEVVRGEINKSWVSANKMIVYLEKKVTDAGEWELAIPEGAAKYEEQNVPEVKFVYTIEGEVVNRYYLIGDFTGGWEQANDVEMTSQDGKLYTVTLNNFDVKPGKLNYEYKVRANHNWDGFQLPEQGNANYSFEATGTYNVTITANITDAEVDGIAAYSFSVKAEKQAVEEKTFTVTFSTKAPWNEVYAYVWNENPVYEFEGAWPGKKLEAENGVYTYTYTGEKAPEMIIFNNGQGGEGNQTEDLAFVDGKAYTYEYFDMAAWVAQITIDPAEGEVEYFDNWNTFGITFPENVTLVGKTATLRNTTLNKEYAMDDLKESAVYQYKIFATVTNKVTDGGAYELTIPEGTVQVNGKDVPELKFNYTIADKEMKYYLVGDFTGGWEEANDVEMTSTDGNVYTYTFDEFTVNEEKLEYSYKVRANHSWDLYQLPQQGNATYKFYKAGNYKVTVTADIEKNKVSVEAENLDEEPLQIEKMYIVGDFTGGFPAGDANADWSMAKEMVKDANDANVWTLTINVDLENKNYEYKAVANGQWGIYELPAQGNQSYMIYEAGNYDVTFTANTNTHELKATAERKGPAVGINTINVADDAVIYNMQGVRMQNISKKGLYIINGKKVMK